MSRFFPILLATPLLVGSAAAQEASPAFVNVEYWECPAENMAALISAADSIWAPIFDELTTEGRFLSWRSQRPTRTFEYNVVNGRATREEVSPRWQWVAVWSATSEEDFNAAWSEFLRRLRSRFPDDPRPTRFCGDLTVVQYVEHRSR